MLTYELTTREDSDADANVRTIDCAYFQSDIHFVSFKNGSHKTVFAVPTDHVVSIDLKADHDGAGESGKRAVTTTENEIKRAEGNEAPHRHA